MCLSCTGPASPSRRRVLIVASCQVKSGNTRGPQAGPTRILVIFIGADIKQVLGRRAMEKEVAGESFF